MPGGRRGRQGAARRRGHLRAGRRPGERAPHRRHGVPEGEPVPDHVDLRQRHRRLQDRRSPKTSASSDEIVEQSLRGPGLWEEVQDRLNRPGRGPLRRAAAAAVHRPGARRRAAGAADGRALLGASTRSPRCPSRRPDRRARRPASPSSSSRTTCNRRPGSPTARRSSWPATRARQTHRVRRDHEDLLQPFREGDEDYIPGRFGWAEKD